MNKFLSFLMVLLLLLNGLGLAYLFMQNQQLLAGQQDLHAHLDQAQNDILALKQAQQDIDKRLRLLESGNSLSALVDQANQVVLEGLDTMFESVDKEIDKLRQSTQQRLQQHQGNAEPDPQPQPQP